ncbi:unnamed protein product, partial [Polarella glacialis]
PTEACTLGGTGRMVSSMGILELSFTDMCTPCTTSPTTRVPGVASACIQSSTFSIILARRCHPCFCPCTRCTSSTPSSTQTLRP